MADAEVPVTLEQVLFWGSWAECLEPVDTRIVYRFKFPPGSFGIRRNCRQFNVTRAPFEIVSTRQRNGQGDSVTVTALAVTEYPKLYEGIIMAMQSADLSDLRHNRLENIIVIIVTSPALTGDPSDIDKASLTFSATNASGDGLITVRLWRQHAVDMSRNTDYKVSRGADKVDTS